MQVKREEETDPYVYEKLKVEVFEVGEDNIVKRVNEFVLKKSSDGEETDMKYKAKKYNSDNGYFNHA